MLLLFVVFCILAGSLFHMCFSAAFSILAASVVLNYVDNMFLGSLVLVGTFLVMCILKYVINGNTQEGIIDFDIDKIQPQLD